eukprot:94895-Rhodomonas_salina.2
MAPAARLAPGTLPAASQQGSPARRPPCQRLGAECRETRGIAAGCDLAVGLGADVPPEAHLVSEELARHAAARELLPSARVLELALLSRLPVALCPTAHTHVSAAARFVAPQLSQDVDKGGGLTELARALADLANHPRGVGHAVGAVQRGRVHGARAGRELVKPKALDVLPVA